LLALDDLKANTAYTSAEKSDAVTINTSIANLELYGFTPLWLISHQINAAGIDELYQFAVFKKARYVSLTTEVLAGDNVRLMFTNTAMANNASNLIYKGMTEYSLAKFGKLVYESSTDPASNSLWTNCSPFSSKTGRTS